VVLTADFDKENPAGRKPIDAFVKFRLLVARSLYNLWDEQVQYRRAIACVHASQQWQTAKFRFSRAKRHAVPVGVTRQDRSEPDRQNKTLSCNAKWRAAFPIYGSQIQPPVRGPRTVPRPK
jgi:hypothetical protein